MIASQFTGSVSELDPAKINNVDDYELVRNLYSRLIEHNHAGEIRPGLAKSFVWRNGTWIFTFTDENRTIDGQIIGANDAAYSLKRAVFLKKTGHADIRALLCPATTLRNMKDSCEGISVKGTELVLRPHDPLMAQHLISLLDSADFSIIPLSALSTDPTNPEILNKRETSGPYFVKEERPHGNWLLEANSQNFHFNSDMPQVVQLKTDVADPLDALERGEIDLIPSTINLGGEANARRIDQAKDFNVYESIPIRVQLICFTPRAVKNFTEAQRFYAAKLYAKAFASQAVSFHRQDTLALFQQSADGALDANQIARLEELRNADASNQFPKPLKVPNSRPEVYRKLLAGYEGIIEIVPKAVSSYKLPMSEREDMYSIATDSAWTESVSLIGYNFKVGTFHSVGIQPEEWMNKFILTEKKTDRMKMLNQLHFDLLRHAIIYPFAVSPYITVMRKNWSLDASTFFAALELWNIRSR